MSSTNGAPKRSTFTTSTLVPISLVASFLIAAVSFSRWLDAQFVALRQDNAALRAEVVALKRQLGEQWTVRDMEVWALRAKTLNPSLNVPDAGEVRRVRVD
jgi:hypothetical protein